MKKLVIKTSLITLASIIVALSAVFGAFCLFAPASVAVFFDGVGNYSASVFFYEKQYEKSGDILDLDALFIKSYGVKDYGRSERYLGELINHDNFESLLSKDDALSDKEYYYGCYVLSLAKNGKIDKACEVSQEFVSENGYTKHNPLSTLVLEYVDENTAENEKQTIKSAITACTNVSTLQEAYRVADLLKLN